MEEVGSAVTSEDAAIKRDGIFRTRRIDRLDRRRSLAALVNAQHELAFRKRYVSAKVAIPGTRVSLWGLATEDCFTARVKRVSLGFCSARRP